MWEEVVFSTHCSVCRHGTTKFMATPQEKNWQDGPSGVRRRIVNAVLSGNKIPKRGTRIPVRAENIHIRYDHLNHMVEPQERQIRCRLCHAKCLTRCRKCDVGLHVK